MHTPVIPLIPHIPSIQTLRAFEAAVRHASYRRAAEELAVTHGAISQHIARLEEDLGGVKLFVREGPQMLPTNAAQTLVVQLRAGLLQITAGLQQVRALPSGKSNRRTLTLSVLPSFAVRWLVPRLAEFQALHPVLDIVVRPTSTLASLDSRDGIDIAIRYGAGHWPGLQATRLMQSEVFPVASPAFLARSAITGAPELLQTALLRHARQPWRPWLNAAGLDWPEPLHGPVYDDDSALLQAAVAGHGIALARAALASDDLVAGRLVQIGEVTIEDDFSWYLVWREPVLCDRADFEAFQAWLTTTLREVA
jgi:LysR family transcriptional regulator, glycine cleavage system transcriptional activator